MKDIKVKEVMIPISNYIAVKKDSSLIDVLQALEEARRVERAHASDVHVALIDVDGDPGAVPGLFAQAELYADAPRTLGSGVAFVGDRIISGEEEVLRRLDATVREKLKGDADGRAILRPDNASLSDEAEYAGLATVVFFGLVDDQEVVAHPDRPVQNPADERNIGDQVEDQRQRQELQEPFQGKYGLEEGAEHAPIGNHLLADHQRLRHPSAAGATYDLAPVDHVRGRALRAQVRVALGASPGGPGVIVLGATSH